MQKSLIFLANAWKPPEERSCFLPNQITFQNANFLLRKFQDGEREAILVGPPNAGHSSRIAWFAPEKSIVEKLMILYPAHPIYAIDWLPAKNDAQGIDELATDVKICVEKIGGKVHLIGLCMCGWLFYIYAALFPKNVLSITTAGSPLNTDGGQDGKIYEWTRKLPIEFFQALAPAGIWWGGWSIMGFKGMTPEKAFDMYIGRYFDLWRSLDDPEALERYHNFWDWFDSPNLMSFRWMRWIIFHHFQRNNLYKGKCEVLGRRVDFNNVTCRKTSIAGRNDDVTMLGEIMGAIKNAREIILDDCGHIGIYISAKALKQWEPGLRWAIEGRTDMEYESPSEADYFSNQFREPRSGSLAPADIAALDYFQNAWKSVFAMWTAPLRLLTHS
jgi:pimeloyl-ACP methyl ester carboxylesterase